MTDSGERVDRVRLGRLASELHFMTRNVWTVVRVEGDRVRASLDLPAGAVGVLSVVADNAGITQNDVASLALLHKTAVASLVKQMVAMNLLSRTRSKHDGRVNRLNLTPRGLTTLSAAERMLAELHRSAFEGVTVEDRRVFFRVCGHIVSQLSNQAEVDRPRLVGREG